MCEHYLRLDGQVKVDSYLVSYLKEKFMVHMNMYITQQLLRWDHVPIFDCYTYLDAIDSHAFVTVRFVSNGYGKLHDWNLLITDRANDDNYNAQHRVPIRFIYLNCECACAEYGHDGCMREVMRIRRTLMNSDLETVGFENFEHLWRRLMDKFHTVMNVDLDNVQYGEHVNRYARCRLIYQYSHKARLWKQMTSNMMTRYTCRMPKLRSVEVYETNRPKDVSCMSRIDALLATGIMFTERPREKEFVDDEENDDVEPPSGLTEAMKIMNMVRRVMYQFKVDKFDAWAEIELRMLYLQQPNYQQINYQRLIAMLREENASNTNLEVHRMNYQQARSRLLLLARAIAGRGAMAMEHTLIDSTERTLLELAQERLDQMASAETGSSPQQIPSAQVRRGDYDLPLNIVQIPSASVTLMRLVANAENREEMTTPEMVDLTEPLETVSEQSVAPMIASNRTPVAQDPSPAVETRLSPRQTPLDQQQISPYRTRALLQRPVKRPGPYVPDIGAEVSVGTANFEVLVGTAAANFERGESSGANAGNEPLNLTPPLRARKIARRLNYRGQDLGSVVVSPKVTLALPPTPKQYVTRLQQLLDVGGIAGVTVASLLCDNHYHYRDPNHDRPEANNDTEMLAAERSFLTEAYRCSFNRCKICLADDSLNPGVLHPCGHGVFCSRCWLNWSDILSRGTTPVCPVCRHQVYSFIRIYI